MLHLLKTWLLIFWEAIKQRDRGWVSLTYPKIHSNIRKRQAYETRLLVLQLVLHGYAFFGWPSCSEMMLQSIMKPLEWGLRGQQRAPLHTFLLLEGHTFASAT